MMTAGTVVPTVDRTATTGRGFMKDKVCGTFGGELALGYQDHAHATDFEN